MFLQGTASVYSKKVEYLWQSVLSMMALLASKKALDEVEGPDGPGLSSSRSKRPKNIFLLAAKYFRRKMNSRKLILKWFKTILPLFLPTTSSFKIMEIVSKSFRVNCPKRCFIHCCHWFQDRMGNVRKSQRSPTPTASPWLTSRCAATWT